MGISVSKIWIDIPVSSKTTVVSNIHDRDIQTGMNNGDTTFVLDASGDSRINGQKYAQYVYFSSGYTLLGTQDSAIADMGSYTYSIDCLSDSSRTIFTTQPKDYISQIILQVPVGLTGTPTLEIGDNVTANSLIDSVDYDLTKGDTYVASDNYTFNNATPITYNYVKGGNTTAGSIKVTIIFGS